MGNNPTISALLDIYGNALTNKQQKCLELYYNQDLSLTEISEHYNITRQGVRDFIERGKSYLFELESKIKFLETLNKVQKNSERIIDISTLLLDYNQKHCGSSSISKYTKQIYKIAQEIYDC